MGIKHIKYSNMSENIKNKIEDKVIDCINLNVLGRLIILKSEKDDFGADLFVEKKGDYSKKGIYIKVNNFNGSPKNEEFLKGFSKKDFKSSENFYLLFIVFDQVRQQIIDRIYFIPSLKFLSIAESAQPEKEEKLFKFEEFFFNKNDLGKIILEKLSKKK